MRIAQVAPLYESVPPRLYGGTERVVSYLTEALVDMGHEVTLFAAGDSETRARLVACCPRALWRDPGCRDTLPHHVAMMSRLFEDVSRFDVVHFHCDLLHLPLLSFQPCAHLTTLHGQLHAPDVVPLLHRYPDTPLVSISDSQRGPLPEANWQATVYHGLPRDLYTFRERPDDYVAFLGRMSPEKRVDRAIEIALAAGIPLKIAARVYPEEQDYFQAHIQPLLQRAGSAVEFVGEIGGRDKDEFLGHARALLFPIDWNEPFGLVMIEAMACGTPVIGWRMGSVPEVLEDGVSGFIVDSVEASVRALSRLDEIDRAGCRRAFEQRFDARRMTHEYVEVYRQVIDASRARGLDARSRLIAGSA